MEKNELKEGKKKRTDCDHYLYEVYGELGRTVELNAEYE